MTTVDPRASIFKAYDIRGVVPDQLDAALVESIGAAAAVVMGERFPDLKTKSFVIGYDMRPSSPELAEAFARGANAQGWDATLIGLASTDMLYFASGKMDMPGAMFTASHNPAQYNGIKMCGPGALPVSIETGGARIRDLALAGTFTPAATPGTSSTADVLDDFAAHVRSFVDTSVLTPLTLVVDAGNGMAGHVLPPVFEGLPFEVEAMYFELDGTFPNHPANPLEPENLVDLQAAVVAGGYPLGLAFDGDADRMFAVDETGRPVPSSLIGAVVADRLLKKEPGATVLYNLICSDIVRETIEAGGGVAVRTRVGHSFIKQRMADTGAAFAAEHSGHYYFRDNYRADSGLIAALLLLEAVAVAGAPLSEVVAKYDVYFASGEINYEVADQAASSAAVEAAFTDRGSVHHEDGLTIRTADGWFNLRASNTEPLLRLNVEGATEQKMVALRDEVAALVNGA